jgi:phosphohistidine phosphatase
MAGEKKLFIVRHGKSSWDCPSVSDIDRPLKDCGIKDAYEMANRILLKGNLPDAIISSPAVRALHTAIIFSRVLKFPPDEIVINQDLYLADPVEIIKVIRNTDDSRKSLMIFGHNPGFTELANYLSGLNIENVPTSGMVLLTYKTDKWKEISKEYLAGDFIDFPKND